MDRLGVQALASAVTQCAIALADAKQGMSTRSGAILCGELSSKRLCRAVPRPAQATLVSWVGRSCSSLLMSTKLPAVTGPPGVAACAATTCSLTLNTQERVQAKVLKGVAGWSMAYYF